MVAVCEFAGQRSDQVGSCYNIFSPGDDVDEVENYLLFLVDGIGFVVIRQTIDVRGTE